MHKEIKDLDMGMFKVSEKQLLKDRNDLFKNVGIPELQKNGFIKSTFKAVWFGEYYSEIQGYIYEFSRLSGNSILENITVYISKGDKWIKIFLNIFELHPRIESLAELQLVENSVKFSIPPNSTTKMRLRSDEYKGPPLFYMLFLPEHKIGSYYTKSGYEAEINKLKKLIKSDMENIDSFVKRWHELHKPNVTDWEGNIIAKATQ
jgi:hypothetical protein